ncbi:DUF397 domain-containing protein [Hamadaea tsunoensis]|uniref:DUF397 domain-containing protein n=1 Tax=Hamadaea tsunoensis TaxID=53368 RepID=UPI0003F6BA19|nr:DUF397 domain-containing protein [Hamadaea tsunoensis]
MAPTPQDWQRSRRCDSGSCLEVAYTNGEVWVRNSNQPDGPRLAFSRAEWEAFLGGVADGQFRILNDTEIS